MPSNELKNHHLMWRAGFGPSASQLHQSSTLKTGELFKALQNASSKKPEFIEVADNYLKGLVQGIQEIAVQKRNANVEERKKQQQQSRQAMRNLNLLWLNEMVDSKAQLREKISFFWHCHFASRNLNVFYQQDILHTIRENALGNFRDLLHNVSKSAAMLNFLNAAQNKKNHPNENFARELMELFTLGRGNYSEKDVKEAARAFTGWGANAKGEFIYRNFQHDNGSKTVLGYTGKFGGEDVIDILLDQPQTALFITQKIYKFFINENIEVEKTKWLADRFYKNNYNITKLFEDIFTSDWFYDEKNIGSRIKSPVELIAGIRRMLPMEIKNVESVLILQRILGQVLFYPPNVAGWPGGKSWIDSSTLLMRMRLPQLMTDSDVINISPKIDDDLMMGTMDTTQDKTAIKGMGKIGKPLETVIDWKIYIQNFEQVPRPNLLGSVSNCLLQIKPSFENNILHEFIDASTKENYIKTATIQIMSTPEYQMC